MSGVEVKNTLCFDFENGSAKPTLNEIANFVKSLDADANEMEATYRISEEKSIFIKFKSEEPMLHALRSNNEELIFHYDNGKAVKVHMSPAIGKVQYVRLYDLPPEVPDNVLVSVLSKYGKVKRVVREKFPAELGLDMHTGVRGVYMDVKTDIPSSLHFLNRKGNIFYDGNKNLCFLCKLEGHLMNSCPKRKARKQQGTGKPKEGRQQEVDSEVDQQQRQSEEQQQQQDQDRNSNNTFAGAVAGSVVDISDNEPEGMVEVPDEEKMDATFSETVENKEEEAKTVQKQKPPVFKCRTDAYYYHKFGIVDYTEKQRIKDEEEAKRLALWQEKRLEEERELRRRQKEAAKLRSPPRKNKKNNN